MVSSDSLWLKTTGGAKKAKAEEIEISMAYMG